MVQLVRSVKTIFANRDRWAVLLHYTSSSVRIWCLALDNILRLPRNARPRRPRLITDKLRPQVCTLSLLPTFLGGVEYLGPSFQPHPPHISTNPRNSMLGLRNAWLSQPEVQDLYATENLNDHAAEDALASTECAAMERQVS